MTRTDEIIQAAHRQGGRSHHDLEVRYWTKSLASLKGARIIDAAPNMYPNDHSDEVWPMLLVQTVNGKQLILTVSRDEEGNGPGALFVEAL